MKTAGPGSKPQIAWALVVLGESRAFDDVMKLYRLGHLSKVNRLGGGTAFDPNKIVALVPLDKLASTGGRRERVAVRQLGATVLSDNAEPKVDRHGHRRSGQDKDAEVARQAAPESRGKARFRRSHAALIRAGSRRAGLADKESRTRG